MRFSSSLDEAWCRLAATGPHLTRVGQWTGFLAPLARVLVGHFGVKLGQPDIEGALQARGLFLALGRGEVAQMRQLIFQLEHQAIAFEEIFVAIHRATPRANSKDQNYRLTFDSRTTECARFAELHRFRRLLRFFEAGMSPRCAMAFWAARAARAAAPTPRSISRTGSATTRVRSTSTGNARAN